MLGVRRGCAPGLIVTNPVLAGTAAPGAGRRLWSPGLGRESCLGATTKGPQLVPLSPLPQQLALLCPQDVHLPVLRSHRHTEPASFPGGLWQEREQDGAHSSSRDSAVPRGLSSSLPVLFSGVLGTWRRQW